MAGKSWPTTWLGQVQNDFVSYVSPEQMQQRVSTIYWEWEKGGKGHHQ